MQRTDVNMKPNDDFPRLGFVVCISEDQGPWDGPDYLDPSFCYL